MEDITYSSLLCQAADNFDAVVAVRSDGRTLTHRALHERVLSLASALRSVGARKGDRLALLLENSVEYLEVERCALTAGYIKVGINYRLSDQEVLAILDDSGAAVLVTTERRAQGIAKARGSLPTLREVLVVDADTRHNVINYQEFCQSGDVEELQDHVAASDTAVLMYSSGTTGAPKGAAITQRAWAATAKNMLVELPFIDSNDLLLHVAPMGHFGGCAGQAYALRGAGMNPVPEFDAAAVLQTIERQQITAVPLVPTMLQRLVVEAESNSYDLRSLRAIPYGGAPMSEEWLRRAAAAFGDVLYQMYGLSEVLAPLSCLGPLEHHARGSGASARLRSAGRANTFTQMRVVNDEGQEVAKGERGELLVRGDTMMSGYWNKPEQTRQVMTPDSWFRTEDIATIDDEGYLTIVDRKRDLIISGGFNITPGEVERAISAMPEVHQVVVFGVPHPDLGEAVMAAIVPAGGAAISLDMVQAACRRQLASYKKPLMIRTISSLPENASGKLQRRALVQQYRETFSHDAERASQRSPTAPATSKSHQEC